MTTDEIAQKHESSGAAGYPWDGWFELLVAVILGLATLDSAWSAYQSALWSGVQTFRLAESTAAGRRAGENFVYANQLRGADLVLFEAYLRALTENNQRLAEFLFPRLRLGMTTVVASGRKRLTISINTSHREGRGPCIAVLGRIQPTQIKRLRRNHETASGKARRSFAGKSTTMGPHHGWADQRRGRPL